MLGELWDSATHLLHFHAYIYAVQVQEARSQGGAYGGEATGIKARVAKSRRFGS